MRLFNWWKRWKKGDAVCKVASADALNRVYNVLEDIEAEGLNGIDATLNKPTGADGKGWTLTVDGYPMQTFVLNRIANSQTFITIINNAVENYLTDYLSSQSFITILNNAIDDYIYPESGEEVAKVLGGTDYTAAQDTWTMGEKINGVPCYPVFKAFRVFWKSDTNTLYWFYRTLTYNSKGLLVAVSAETANSVTITGGGGAQGYTGSKTVVTDVAWDETNHKFTRTTEVWTYNNGLLTSVATATTSDIVTLVPEMP